jgi:hypothetical protein
LANTVLVQGKVVRLEGKEGWTNDRGHLLRYVWLGDEMVNAELVRLGYARCDVSLVGSPHLDALARLEQAARQRAAGIWSAPQGPLASADLLAPPSTPSESLQSPLPDGTASLAGSSAEVTADPTPALSVAPTSAVLLMNMAPPTTAPTTLPEPTRPPIPTEAPPQFVTAMPEPATPSPTALPPTAPPTSAPAPTDPPPPAPTGGVQITKVHADGDKGRTEPDEYCEIKNTGEVEVNLQGWLLNAGAKTQNYDFPPVVLGPGQSVRVYTNEIHPESGGLSFGSGSALWKNGGDCGYLYDASGQQVHSLCY